MCPSCARRGGGGGSGGGGGGGVAVVRGVRRAAWLVSQDQEPGGEVDSGEGGESAGRKGLGGEVFFYLS